MSWLLWNLDILILTCVCGFYRQTVSSGTFNMDSLPELCGSLVIFRFRLGETKSVDT